MLSSNSSLQNGRFRVIGLFGEADGGHLYDAFDDQIGQKVVIHESSDTSDFADRLSVLKNRQIKGIAHITDGFVEGSYAYLVTESLEGRASADEFMNDPATSIGTLLSGIQSLIAQNANAGVIEINPQLIRRAHSGSNCLLNFTTGSSPNASLSNKLTPFSSLESVWPGLDMATQKAIANSCDEEAMASIDSPADERTFVYSLGASLYQILAGKSPLDVLVRSIELLDDKGDPLRKLSELRPSVDSELSDVLSRMIALKRNERASLSVAMALVGSLKPKQSAVIELDLDDDLDLLEIPFEPTAQHRTLEPKPVVQANSFDSVPEMPAIIAAVDDKVEEPKVVEETPAMVAEAKPDAMPKVEPFLPSVSPTPRSEAEVPSFAVEPVASGSGNGMKIAAAAAGLLIVAVVGWFVLGSGSGASASASTATPESKAEPVATSVDTPAVSGQVPAEPAVSQPAAANTSTQDQEPNVDATKQPKRPVVAEVKPQTKPTPAKTEKPKKAMTVDDLLKDN